MSDTAEEPDGQLTTQDRRNGGVFVSHVHEDKLLADAFAMMLKDASAGAVEVYSSSDNTAGGGIRYGAEWFQWITGSIERADHVVALLTPRSVERPWILFEAGLGKAKANGSVFGLALGINVAEASRGPFGVFQNSGSDEGQLLKLCRQLLAESPARPRDEMLAETIKRFRSVIDDHVVLDSQDGAEGPSADAAAVYQAIEDLRYQVSGGVYRRDAYERDELSMRLLRVMDETGQGLSVGLRVAVLAGVAEDLDLRPIGAVFRDVLLGRSGPHRNGEAVEFFLRNVVHELRPWSEASAFLRHLMEREVDMWMVRRRAADERRAYGRQRTLIEEAEPSD